MLGRALGGKGFGVGTTNASSVLDSHPHAINRALTLLAQCETVAEPSISKAKQGNGRQAGHARDKAGAGRAERGCRVSVRLPLSASLPFLKPV